MNLDHFRLKLLEKQRECESDLSAFEDESRVADQAEVRDSTDDAVASQSASEALEEGSIVSQTLEEVQDALRRIEEGTYGKCLICGREIEAGRLEAIPWARYCLEHQENKDQGRPSMAHDGASL